MFTNVFDLISFVGALQGVLLGIFLFTRRNKQPGTNFLAWYVLLFSIGLLEPFAVRTVSGPLRIPLLSFLGSSNFLYGPLLYLWVRSLTTADPLPGRKQPQHFFVFLLAFIVETSLSYAAVNSPAHDIFLFEALIVQILLYNMKAIHRLKVNEPTEGKWLKSLLIFITAIYVLSFFISHLILFGLQSAEAFYLLVQLAITVMIYGMTYRLILRPEIFLSRYSRMGDTHGSGLIKYVKSGLKEEQAEDYLRQLMLLMEKEKPYQDPDLSIYTLAQKLNISRNHLTQIINEKLNRNFYELINSYRVEEVKKMLLDPSFANITLTGIGLEAGFKSKTAFNLNFKKITGFTPTEWKRAHAPGAVQKIV